MIASIYDEHAPDTFKAVTLAVLANVIDPYHGQIKDSN